MFYLNHSSLISHVRIYIKQQVLFAEAFQISWNQKDTTWSLK